MILLDAIEQNQPDVMQKIFTADIKVWHNTDEKFVYFEDVRNTINGIHMIAKSIQYVDRRITAFPGGCVCQHVVEAVSQDEKEVRIPVCLLSWVRVDADGKLKICRQDEYIDSAKVDEFKKFAPKVEQ